MYHLITFTIYVIVTVDMSTHDQEVVALYNIVHICVGSFFSVFAVASAVRGLCYSTTVFRSSIGCKSSVL